MEIKEIRLTNLSRVCFKMNLAAIELNLLKFEKLCNEFLNLCFIN